MFRLVFEDLRVDRELRFSENVLVIPTDTRQAVLNCIQSRHAGRDALLGPVDEVWLPQIIRQVVAASKRCANCQKQVRTLNQ